MRQPQRSNHGISSAESDEYKRLPAHREVTPTEKAKPVPARQWVLDALADGPMTPRQAARLAGGMWTRNALGTALRELYKEGRASRRKDRHGAYVYEIQEKQT